MIEEIADMNNVKFFDYGNDERFQRAPFFQDAGPLNDTDAKKYMMDIAEMLNKFCLR